MLKTYFVILFLISIMISCNVSYAETPTPKETTEGGISKDCETVVQAIYSANLTYESCKLIIKGKGIVANVCKHVTGDLKEIKEWCCKDIANFAECAALAALLAE